MRAGQGQRLRPTAERKGSGETQPNSAGGGYHMTDSAFSQSEYRTLVQLYHSSQSVVRINPRTDSRSVVEQQYTHMVRGRKGNTEFYTMQERSGSTGLHVQSLTEIPPR